MSIFAELKRRNVIRVGIAYMVASWVLMQIVDVIAPVLELPAWAPKLVLVMLAIGLIPALIFSWVYEMTPEGLKKDSEVDRSQSIAGQTGRKLNYITTGFLVVAVGLLLAERQFGSGGAVGTDADEEITSTEILDSSIAVLPFVNMSSDMEQEFFSDGITEEILNSLASVPSLKVAGRTSSFAFKGQNDDLRRIGDSLGVAHILEGSVRKSGNQIRVTAQLIQVEDGFHLWSETYDRELNDVFAIQDEIANEILNQLTARLLDDGAEVQIAEASRTSPQVYELYLQGKQRIYTRNGGQLRLALEELDKAIALDENYAPAYAQRGIATMLLTEQQYGDIPNDEAHRRGKRYIDEALRLDPNLAEAWAGMGLWDGGTSEQRIDALIKALELNPNHIDASNWLQIELREAGEMAAALDMLIEIMERDPLYRPAFANAMMAFNAFGRTDKAEELVRRIEAFDPENPELTLAKAYNHMYAGRFGEGLKLLEEEAAQGPIHGVKKNLLGFSLLNTGQPERAVEEGSAFVKPEALYDMGRVDEAIELAYEFARAGEPGALFYMLPREGRSQEMIDYLEERWPSLQLFASEYPGGDGGWGIMHNVALAYLDIGNQAKADEALGMVQQRLDKLESEGVDFIGLTMSNATQSAMLGDTDKAFAYLEQGIDRGAFFPVDPYRYAPEWENLFDDPRFPVMRAQLLENFNNNRQVLGLPPYDDNYQVMTTQ